MIPVLDIAKANPRIPLPIIALLRLKTDMPNDVLPSNYNKSRTDRRLDWRTAHASAQEIGHILCLLYLITQALTSVKRLSFLTPVLWGRNSSCSAMASTPSNLQRGQNNEDFGGGSMKPKRHKGSNKNTVSFILMGLTCDALNVWHLPVVFAVSIHLLELHPDCWGYDFWTCWTEETLFKLFFFSLFWQQRQNFFF